MMIAVCPLYMRQNKQFLNAEVHMKWQKLWDSISSYLEFFIISMQYPVTIQLKMLLDTFPNFSSTVALQNSFKDGKGRNQVVPVYNCTVP
jgi:hypothetical protein